MPRIDFYILPDQAADGRVLLACRLCEKAFQHGHRIYIQAASPEQARILDDLLWTFRQGSFVPHALCPAGDSDMSPVLIGAGADIAAQTAEVVINLDALPPPDFDRFERVMEIVDQHPDILAQSRQRYRFYRERGYPPDSHKL
ncbi:MAG: DNA polymerase III subunit chi [Gammaproteobacteria bacterium]|nr:DNA polymerase III subunit chi [Gammaproteobacteria bacterium]MCP5425971.1 DNA polymerase III subunit chi [Gammaproteobacteria bacterium]MCP5458841.1 DNA polymerase III subunit chi [Gammaproteobacteria bacterium]